MRPSFADRTTSRSFGSRTVARSITHLSRALEADRTDFRGKPEAPAPEAKPEQAEDLEKAPVGAEPCGVLAINQACPDGVTTRLPWGTKQA